MRLCISNKNNQTDIDGRSLSQLQEYEVCSQQLRMAVDKNNEKLG